MACEGPDPEDFIWCYRFDVMIDGAKDYLVVMSFGYFRALEMIELAHGHVEVIRWEVKVVHKSVLKEYLMKIRYSGPLK